MNAIDIVKRVLTDAEKGIIDESVFTEDMTLSGPVPKPVNRYEFVSLMKDIVGACPDWNFNARDYTAEGDTVRVTIGITGTQTRTLPAIVPGMTAFPATNRRFTLPEEHLTFKVRGGKISSCVADVVPGGGVMGLLSQLGVQLLKAA